MIARHHKLGLLVALLCGACLLPAAADARKLGNAGTSTSFVATVLNGSSIKVGSQEFGFNESDPVTITGTVNNTTGVISVASSGFHFPNLSVDTPLGAKTVHINVVDTVTGTINPISASAGNLVLNNLRVWIQIDDLGSCKIGSSGSPITVSPLTTGTSGSVSGDPYDPSDGSGKIVNGTFTVPGADGCSYLGIGINSQVNDAVGIPSAAPNNNAQFIVDFNPTLTKGVNASFTATPSSGTVPLMSSLNASGSTVAGGVKTCTPALPITLSCGYRWDYDNNGIVDEVTNGPTVSHAYATLGTSTTKLTIFDNDGDSDSTTRTITVNPPPPDLTIDKSHTGNFLATTNGSYTLAVSNIGAGATQGTTTVLDTLPAGLTFVSGTGSGWACSAVLQAVTCTRAATINAGSSAPNITLTAAAAAGAASSVTNTAAVSAVAGSSPETALANNSDTDPTTIDKVDAGIVKTAVGTFETGTIETYNLAVTTGGSVPTTGTTTVTDLLPSGLTYQGYSAPAGWSCSAVGQNVTCTHAAGLPVGTNDTIAVDVVAGTVAVPSVNNTANVSTPNDSNSANNSSTINTPVTPTVDLTIDKSHAGAFRVGSAASYTIAVQNRGARPTAGTTTVSDTLPDGLTPTGASGGGWSCGISGQDVTCTSTDSLGAGASAPLITLDVLVDQDAFPSKTNTASVSTSGTGNDADSNTANDSDDDPTTITATDLTIDKSHVGGFPIAGQGNYTLSVRNDGSAPTVGTITVSDTLPAELTFVNATGSGWSCGAVGQDVTCTRTTPVGAGQTAPAITLVVDVADTEEESTTNSASVSGADDVNPTNDSDTDPTPLTAADLQLTKTHTGDFRIGTSRAYVLRVSNVGSQPTSGDSTVTDELPDGLSYVDATGSGWSCGHVDDNVTCTRTSVIASGANAPPITIQVAVDSTAYPGVTNSATVSNGDDRNDANDTASDPTTITGADLAVTKSHIGGLQVNDRASYLIRVDNFGTADSVGPATVTDTMPDGLTYAGSPSAAWECSNSGQDVTCVHDGSIAAGSHADLELRADVDESADDEVTNSASVALDGDPVSANNGDDDVAGIGDIDLTIDKSHDADLTRGGSGSYELLVSNEGSDPTDGPAHVTDTLPAGLSYAGAGGTGWTCSLSAGTVSCAHAGTIDGGDDAAPITLDVDVAPGAATQITNTASVSTSDDADSSNDSDSDQADVTAGRDAAISIRPQYESGGSFRVHENGTYTVTVRNAGPGALPGPVTATVHLPDGLSFAGAQGGGFSCADASGTVTCTDADGMPTDTRSDIALEVEVSEAAAPGVTTTADVSASGDTNAANDTAQAATAVSMIDLSITMQHTGTFAVATPSSFTINVENAGTATTVTPIRVVDELPAGLTFNGGSGTGWTCTASGQVVSCNHPDPLDPVEQASPLSLSVTPQASVGSQTLTNTARVLTQDDGEALNNLTTDDVTIGPAPAPLGQVGASAKCPKKKKKGKKGAAAAKKKKCKKKKKK